MRKHLSSVKGGNLANYAYPAKIITLAISDVPGDEFGVIASGPTYPDNTTNKDALDVLFKYNIRCSKNIYEILKSENNETPKKNNKDPNRNRNRNQNQNRNRNRNQTQAVMAIKNLIAL